MRWIDKYNKEKERKYKEEHSKITVKQLNQLFIKYLKRRGLFGTYISYIYDAIGNEIWRKDFFANMTYDNAIDSRSMYLNEKSILNIYGTHIIFVDWVCSRKDFLSLETLVKKETDEFIRFLRENGYNRYIPICIN